MHALSISTAANRNMIVIFYLIEQINYSLLCKASTKATSPKPSLATDASLRT